MDFGKAIVMLEEGAGCEAVAHLIGCEPKGAGRKISMWPELRDAQEVGKRKILEMREIHKMSVSEIALETGRTVASVNTLLRRQGSSRGKIYRKKPGPKPAESICPNSPPWDGKPEDTIVNRWIQRKWA